MYNRNNIVLQRIANGYNVFVPQYEKPFNPQEKQEKIPAGSFIPKVENIFFKETLKDVFDFLTEIEKNPQPVENGFYAASALRAEELG